MASPKPIDLSALSEHRRILNLWLAVVFAGLLLFGGLLILSYFVLNAPSLTTDSVRYKRAEASLGFSELSGLVISVVAMFRYMNVRSKYHKQIYDQLLIDNGWLPKKKYNIDKVASILMGAGGSYEEGYQFSGNYMGRTFSCLVFEFIAPDSKTKRFICLSFKLSKAYPMLVIDNRLNDHGYRRHLSDLPDRIPNGVNVSLEGDFDKHYQVSTTKDSEQESLEILSPDFMAILEDRAGDKVDIEISDKDLFLIYEADFYSAKNLTSLFATADAVLGKLDKLSKTWLASSKGEEAGIAEMASVARHKLIFRNDLVSAIVALLIFVIFVVLMISDIKDSSQQPPCTPSIPCDQLPL